MPITTPTRPTNHAFLHTENARVSGDGGRWSIDLPYADVELVDKTPDTPLELWNFDSYQVRVNSGQVVLSDAQATAMLQSMGGESLAKKGVTDGRIAFLAGDRIELSARYKVLGIGVPFRLTYQVLRRSDTELMLVPSKGTQNLLQMAGLDLKAMLPAGPSAVRAGADGALTLNLAALADFEGRLTGLKLAQGRAVLTLGDAKPAAIAPNRRANLPNWAELRAEGTIRLENGLLRNGTVVARDTASTTVPLMLNSWEHEGLAHRESGDIMLDEALFTRLLSNADPSFKLDKASLTGNRLDIKGSYNFNGKALFESIGLIFGGVTGYVHAANPTRPVPDIGVPVTFSLVFALMPDGRLKVSPAASTGLVSPDRVRSFLTKLPGAVSEGQGVVLDLAALASLEATPVRQLKTEPGRLVLAL